MASETEARDDFFWSWVPNALTSLRLALAVLLPWLPAGWQFWLLMVAGFSDLVDGWLSRRLGAVTEFGRLFDPIADKILVLSAVGTALFEGWLTWLELLVLVTRDLTVMILCALSLMLTRMSWRRWKPRLLDKLTTAGQVIALLTLFWVREPVPTVVWIAAAVSVVAAVDYSLAAFREGHSG